jgi:hypothetical protein
LFSLRLSFRLRPPFLSFKILPPPSAHPRFPSFLQPNPCCSSVCCLITWYPRPECRSLER